MSPGYFIYRLFGLTSYQVSLKFILYPENVGEIVLTLQDCGWVNLNVIGKAIGYNEAQLGSPGKNLSEMLGM